MNTRINDIKKDERRLIDVAKNVKSSYFLGNILQENKGILTE